MNPFTVLWNELTRNTAQDRSLKRQEIASRKRQGAKLRHFFETGETDPPAKERMETLTRGSEATSTAWLRELLAKYQLELETSIDGRSVRLMDIRYAALTNNTISIDMAQMLGAGYGQWEVKLRTARFNIRRRAIRAGLQTKNPGPGKPRKGSE